MGFTKSNLNRETYSGASLPQEKEKSQPNLTPKGTRKIPTRLVEGNK